jgi:nucleotide-binding universal stress UspA family protein
LIERSDTYRILLPLDGSELATMSIPYARALATADSELVVCRIAPDPTPLMELAGTTSYPIERIRKSKLDEAEAYLGAVAEAIRDITPHVSTVSRVGEPPDEILSIAIQERVDLIVMASHGRGFLGRFVAGSVADRVARASPVPVMLIHPTHEEGAAPADSKAMVHRLVVPLDGSARARQALPVASGLARRLGSPIHLVQALPTREQIVAHRHSIGDEYYSGFTTAAAAALRDEGSRLGAAGLTVTSEVVIGPAARSILEVLRDGDIIVMSSHGQGGVRRWLLGSVAERLIHSGSAPVVLVPVIERRKLTRDTT